MNAKTNKQEKEIKAPKNDGIISNGLNADIYNIQGKKTGSIELPEDVFGVKWNDALMHQVVTSMQANARPHVAHTKGRGEVRGGGRKPWQQKGTGRARHGSIRSPIWKGGGVTHGPLKEKVYARAIPKKMRAKALFIALSRKFKEGKVIFVDSLGIEAPKTAVAKKALVSLSKIAGFEKLISKPRNAALIVLKEGAISTRKSFRNIRTVECVGVKSLNPVGVLSSTYLIIENPVDAVAVISARTSKK